VSIRSTWGSADRIDAAFDEILSHNVKGYLPGAKPAVGARYGRRMGESAGRNVIWYCMPHASQERSAIAGNWFNLAGSRLPT
jgi:hypothetical protein